MSIFDRFRRSETGRLLVPPVPGRPVPSGRMVAGYNLDSGLVCLPDHVRELPWRQRRQWMDERGLAPAVGGGAGYGSSFLQMLEPFEVADATTLSASTTETVISSDSIFTLAPNFFANPGKQAWFRAMGKCSNVVTTPGTITFRLRYNGIAGTILTNSGAIAFNPVAVTDNMWYAECWLEALATGVSATALTLMTYGECWLANTAGAAADIRNSSMPPGGTALANVASLDGTTGKALSLTAQFSVATAGTAITVRNAFIVALN